MLGAVEQEQLLHPFNTIQKVDTDEDFINELMSWSAAAFFDWEYANWSIGELFEIHPYKPENLRFFRPKIRVISDSPLVYSKSAYDTVRSRLLNKFNHVLSTMTHKSQGKIEILALMILVAEFGEEISFCFDTRSEFADLVLDQCLRYTLTLHTVLNNLGGFVST